MKLLGVIIIILFLLGITAAAFAPVIKAKYAAVHTGKITIRRFRVSAYCPCQICCGKNACGVTASGHEIIPGEKFAAADKSIPFETMLGIPGYGRVPVLDRGGAIRRDCIDVFFPTHREALDWGIRFLDVVIYEN